jgi:SLAP domain-containing protein
MVDKSQNIEANNIENIEDNREYVSTSLSLLEHDKNVISDVQKEILKDEILELQQIKEGEVNIAGVYAYDLGEKVEVKVYIRNGLAKSVNFGNIPLLVSNSKNETLAYQVFNLSSLGNIPAHCARPVKLYFEKENVNVDKIDINDWNIAFDTKVKVSGKIKPGYENLPEEIAEKDKSIYDDFLSELPELKEGEFTISTFSIGLQKDGSILITVVMRNGNDKPINIQKLPITLKDARGITIKSEIFELKDFTVKPFKAKICNLVMPTTLRLEKEAALKNWSVSFTLENVGIKVN